MVDQTWRPAAAPPESLEAGPVRLHRWRADDAEDLYAAVIASQRHLAPFLPWAHDYDRSRTTVYLGDSQRWWTERAAFNYRVAAPDLLPGRVLGSVGLMARRGPGILEIGYWLHVDAVGRGLAVRSVAALTGAAMALPGVEVIWICHVPENAASAAIPARLGFTRQAEPVEGPPGFEHERDVCWTLSRKDGVPVRG